MSLDSSYTDVDPAHSTVLADGTRCQYNDPDYVNSNSFGETYCYPGMSYGVIMPFDWHVHRTTNSDGGRAFIGSQSLHWGRHKVTTDPDKDTEALSALQAIGLANPVYLGFAAQPELSFKHEIALMDFRVLNSPYLQGPDRAVVALQLADPGTGNPVGIWQKLYPYQNIYDVQPTNNYINCTFDPTDDGTNEDSYFDPSDPNRFYGPSSTCMPEFVFSQQGDTNWRNPYIAGNTLRSSDDPIGMKGSIDRGNWVETRFNLDRFKGRAVRVRMLVSTIKVGDAPDAIAALGASFAPRPTDDGWFIDDVEISNTLTTPAAISADLASNSGLPACPSTCTTITPSLVANPSSSPGPGQQVVLDASGSTADRCVGGVLQFQFSANGSVVQDWSDIATYTDTPMVDTDYSVLVRCSTLTSCIGGAEVDKLNTVHVPVGCPTTSTLTWPVLPSGAGLFVNKTGGLGPAEPDQNLTVLWGAPTIAWSDVIRGDLNALRTLKTFKGTVLSCVLNDTLVSSTADGSVLTPGNGFYYLGRGGTCNVNPYHWNDAVPTPASQSVNRNGQIQSDPISCP